VIDYEPWLLPCIPKHGNVAFDVGAHEGLFSRILAERFKTVHAIEPNPDVLPVLQCGLPDNVIVHTCAAWDKAEHVTFTRYAHSGHLSAYFKNEGIATGAPIGSVDLDAKPLDDLDIKGRIEFIKIDAEGAEVQVIRAVRATSSERIDQSC
jgi:FkbM family methyltransferase